MENTCQLQLSKDLCLCQAARWDKLTHSFHEPDYFVSFSSDFLFSWRTQPLQHIFVSWNHIFKHTVTLYFQGTKVLVWGGRQGRDPEKPDCHLSTEEYDLEHPELGWTLTEHRTNDPSLCEVQFICEKHESLEVNCKWNVLFRQSFYTVIAISIETQIVLQKTLLSLSCQRALFQYALQLLYNLYIVRMLLSDISMLNVKNFA